MTTPATAWNRLRELPVRVEAARLEPLELAVRADFRRRTTVVRLFGAGHEGAGEDVVYEADDQIALQRAGPPPGLAFRGGLAGLCAHLAAAADHPAPPRHAETRCYRTWAWQSAALDLALRQAGATLGEVLGLAPRPVSFVASPGLGRPPTAEPVRRLLARVPPLRFKLDWSPAWTADLVDELAATGAVDVVDFKGQYRGTTVDTEPDARGYRRVAEAFPRAWLEDPRLTDATRAALAPHADRITWDAPIHSVEDVERLERAPRGLNVKPSRFGSLRELLCFHEHCRARAIALYGGGQFELGPGRAQVQLLAALLHPDAPNDVAPLAYHAPERAAQLPASPLALLPRAGFGPLG